MISKHYKYAVIGASHNPEKYGYKVFKDLLESGYKVTPVNPKGGELLGTKVVKNLSDMDELPDVVITVVPPEITVQILHEAKDLGISKVWMQPGSENIDCAKFCTENGISYIQNACIMVQRKALGRNLDRSSIEKG